MKALIKLIRRMISGTVVPSPARIPLKLALCAELTRPPALAISDHDSRCIVQCYLDTSTSMIRLKKALVERFNAFLDEIADRWMKTGGDRSNFSVCQFAFNSVIRPVQDWTRIDSAQRWSIATFDRHVRSGTALYDTIADGCRQMIKRAKKIRGRGNQTAAAVVFLTDGAENGSRTSFAGAQRLVAEAQAQGILVFFCFIGSRAEQHSAIKTATGLGIDGSTIITADANEAGLMQAFTRASEVMTGTWTGQ